MALKTYEAHRVMQMAKVKHEADKESARADVAVWFAAFVVTPSAFNFNALNDAMLKYQDVVINKAWVEYGEEGDDEADQ